MDLLADDIKDLSLTLARQVVKEGVEEVDVRSGIDISDRPAYFISFRFDDDRARARAALLKTRLSQRIRDELITRGDSHYPFVRLLLAKDWSKRGEFEPG